MRSWELLSAIVFLAQIDRYAIGVHLYDPIGWQKASDFLLAYVNSSIDPCDRFFDHVCGNIGELRSAGGDTEYERQERQTLETLSKSVKSIDLQQSDLPAYTRSIGVFFQQCRQINRYQLTDLRSVYQTVRDILKLTVFETGIENRTRFNPFRFIGRVRSQIGATFLLSVSPKLTFETYEENTVEIQFHLGVPELDQETIEKRLTLLAAGSDIDPLELRRKIKTIASNLTALIEESSEIGDLTSDDYRSITRIRKSVFDRDAYLNALLGTVVAKAVRSKLLTVELETVSAREVGRILRKYDRDTLEAAALLAISDQLQDTYGGAPQLESATQLFEPGENVEELCFNRVMNTMPFGLVRRYFDYIDRDPVEWRTEVLIMVRNIMSAFRYMLNIVDWLDKDDVETIQQKIDSIKIFPTLPEWIGDTNKIMKQMHLHKQNSSFFENHFRNERAFFRYRIRLAYLAVKQGDQVPPFTQNAFYSGQDHVMLLCLGLLSPPLFDIKYPLAVKYGCAGATIGHELIHAFDSRDSLTSHYPGNKRNVWVKDESLTEFDRNARCLVRQYSKYCFKKIGKCIAGDSTIDENIADIDGMKLAFTAYKFVAQILDDDPPLPGMLEYSNDQIFFISAAKEYCTVDAGTPEDLDDSHSPNKARVEVTMRNIRSFADAFRCTVGTRYAPLKRCSVWGEPFQPCPTTDHKRN